MLLPVDLHCHSTHSDGDLSVEEVINLAKKNGGKYLALTDHDTINGIALAKEHASKVGLKLIAGVEISVTWNEKLIHILGLNVDENNQNLQTNLNNLRAKRLTRGERISKELAKAGISNALEGALKYCQSPESLSRTHFARFLVDQGYAKPGRAFDKYLVPGKPGYVDETWASLADAISWIKSSNGIAVIAHPCRYNLKPEGLNNLVQDFKKLGGVGMEVVSGSHSKEDESIALKIAKSHGLLASMGSDFHSQNDNYSHLKLGLTTQLPVDCKTVLPLIIEEDLNALNAMEKV